MQISSILKNLDQSILNEETASQIAEAFETAVNDKVNTKVSLEVESALLKQDKEHAAKLENLIEALDLDHTNKLKEVVEAINENHSSKLEDVVKLYKTSLNKKASKFSEKLIGEMSNYLDLYLEKHIPAQQLEEAVENTHAKVQLEKIKNLLNIDPETLNENVKDVLKKGNSQINELQQKLNESYNENAKLSVLVEKANSAILIEKKTKGMSSSKKDYLNKILCDKSPEYIEENFNYVIEMFEKDDSDERVILAEEAKTKSFSKDAKVPVNNVITESRNNNNNEYDYNPVTDYLTELKRS
jgi:hypothetical protein